MSGDDIQKARLNFNQLTNDNEPPHLCGCDEEDNISIISDDDKKPTKLPNRHAPSSEEKDHEKRIDNLMEEIYKKAIGKPYKLPSNTNLHCL